MKILQLIHKVYRRILFFISLGPNVQRAQSLLHREADLLLELSSLKKRLKEFDPAEESASALEELLCNITRVNREIETTHKECQRALRLKRRFYENRRLEFYKAK